MVLPNKTIAFEVLLTVEDGLLLIVIVAICNELPVTTCKEERPLIFFACQLPTPQHSLVCKLWLLLSYIHSYLRSKFNYCEITVMLAARNSKLVAAGNDRMFVYHNESSWASSYCDYYHHQHYYHYQWLEFELNSAVVVCVWHLHYKASFVNNLPECLAQCMQTSSPSRWYLNDLRLSSASFAHNCRRFGAEWIVVEGTTRATNYYKNKISKTSR